MGDWGISCLLIEEQLWVSNSLREGSETVEPLAVLVSPEGIGVQRSQILELKSIIAAASVKEPQDPFPWTPQGRGEGVGHEIRHNWGSARRKKIGKLEARGHDGRSTT